MREAKRLEELEEGGAFSSIRSALLPNQFPIHFDFFFYPYQNITLPTQGIDGHAFSYKCYAA